MERLPNVPNVNNNGQQAPNQVPATKTTPSVPQARAPRRDRATAARSGVPHAQPVRTAAKSHMLPAHEQSGAQSKLSPVFSTRKVERLRPPVSANSRTLQTTAAHVDTLPNMLPIPFVLDMVPPFVLSGGSQAQPAQVPAKSNVPPIPVPVSSNVPQAQPAQTAARLTAARLTAARLTAARLNVTKRDSIPPITAIRPDGSILDICFSELLQNRSVINVFLEKINYYDDSEQYHEDITTSASLRFQNEGLRKKLGQQGPFRGNGVCVDPFPLYCLLASKPNELGEALAQLGL